MNLDFLKNQPRLLLEAKLKPLQGTRFQPTGFPDLGAATYKAADSTEMLLVESAQSMANCLEKVCWDEASQKPVPDLTGIPYVEAILPDGTKTNSLLEAHRLNSPYIVNSPEFKEIADRIGYVKNQPFNRRKLAEALFYYDPNSLLHGIFLEKIGGVVRLPRALTAFIEASKVAPAANGGVKIDRVQPETTGKVTPYGKAVDGYGNVPYHREDYTGEITVFFNLDLALLRGLGFLDTKLSFLTTFAIYKIRRFLDEGLRLRTACDLESISIEVTRPVEPKLDLPDLAAVAADLRNSIVLNQQQGWGTSPFIVRYDSSKAKKAAEEREKKARSGDEGESATKD
jgi:CRISPR-associated protein Csb1